MDMKTTALMHTVQTPKAELAELLRMNIGLRTPGPIT
jgi:hypothetical protein